MPFIAANHANFYYESHGIGKPLILISGYTTDHLSWRLMLDDLGKHFQVIIFDNRGIGQTKDDNQTLSADLMAQDVIALAAALHLEKPHIVGHSMGGTIAQIIGTHYSDKIDKLCISSSCAKWRPAMLRALRSLLSMRENNINFDLIYASTLPWIFGTAFLTNEKNIIDLKEKILSNPYPQTLSDQQRQFQVLETFNGIKDLSNIKSQTLIAHGIQDLLALPYESEYMANTISKSKRVEYECAHALSLEVPQAFTQSLIEFFK